MAHLASLLPFFARYRRKLFQGLAAIFASVAIGLAAPVVVGRAVDAFMTEVDFRTLAVYGLILIGVTAGSGVFSFLQRLILVSMSRDVEYDLRNDYFAHLESQPPAFFQGHHTGDLMARATNDLAAVRMLCGPAVMYSANTVFTAAGVLFLMARIDWRLTLLALATMPLVAAVTQVFGARIHFHFERVQAQFADLSTRVQENLAGLRVVRSYAREETEIERFAALNREYVERNRRLITWTSLFHPLLRLLVGIGFVAVLWYGGREVGRGSITVGEFVAFNFFLSQLVWPMIAIGWVVNLVQRGSASLARIRQILATEPEIRDRPPLVEGREICGTLRLEGLTVTYEGAAAPALADLDLEVEAGQRVAVVGRTGSGKSTLLAALPRLVETSAGTIRLDGIDARRLPLARLRDAIGLVPQESFLFSTTVGENIALGRAGAGREEILEAARQAGLSPDLEELPRGLDTVVGERGITLSGGQKQRVALARALLRRPRLLLLDDCLSAVDAETEERILDHLREVFAGRTVLQVSHRLSAVRGADQILVLDSGRATERGRHDELVAADGIYADLYRRQRLEEELAAV